MSFQSQIANLKFLWWWFRQVSGDAAYENYLRSAQRSGVGAHVCVRPLDTRPGAGAAGADTQVCPGGNIMSREEFFLDSLRRRYSTISRCC